MNRKKIKPLFKKIKEVLTLEEVLKFIFLKMIKIRYKFLLIKVSYIFHLTKSPGGARAHLSPAARFHKSRVVCTFIKRKTAIIYDTYKIPKFTICSLIFAADYGIIRQNKRKGTRQNGNNLLRHGWNNRRSLRC